MNNRGFEEQSGSAEYTPHHYYRQSPSSNPSELSPGVEANLATAEASYYPENSVSEPNSFVERPEGMTRDYASQPQRTLPGIHDILGVQRPQLSDPSNWNHPTHGGSYAHSRGSSQSYGSENTRILVNGRGQELHPPMALGQNWTWVELRQSEPDQMQSANDQTQPVIATQPSEQAPVRIPRSESISYKSYRADWSQTKSGNPRKRQSEACENCRHKKIKCDPKNNEGGPRICAHCDKLGIDCQWRNQPVVFLNPNPDTESVPPGEHIAFKSLASISSQGSPQTPSPKMSPSSTGRRSAPVFNGAWDDDDTKMPLTKKPRLGWRNSDEAEFTGNRILIETSNQKGTIKVLEADSDPFETDRSVAVDLLNNYFTYHDHSTDKILPRLSFTHWCMEEKHKSHVDFILLFATLALGSVFATTKTVKDRGRYWAEAARLSLDRVNRYNLKLALTKLHLAAFFWAEGQPSLSYDYTGRGVNALAVLGYDTEEGCLDGVSSAAEDNDFGFTSAELVECRRRVFWHGYTTSLIKCSGFPSSHKPSDPDVLVRVPNLESNYDSGIHSEGPYFCAGGFDPSESGLTATKIYIASIWGELVAQQRRSAHSSPEDYLATYDSFYKETLRRLNLWSATLPSKFKYSSENTKKSIKEDYFVEYFVLNACYHIVMMKLHRHGRVDCLPHDTIMLNVKDARYHARRFLELITVIAKADEARGCQSKQTLAAASCQPFALETIMFACDILTARGHFKAMAEVQCYLGHAKSIFTESARVFSSAERQRKCIEARMADLAAYGAMKGSGRPHWNCERTIYEKLPSKEKLEQTSLPKNMDLIYETKEELFFEALDNSPVLEHVTMETNNEKGRSPVIGASRSF